jgi:hypothetical protein
VWSSGWAKVRHDETCRSGGVSLFRRQSRSRSPESRRLVKVGCHGQDGEPFNMKTDHRLLIWAAILLAVFTSLGDGRVQSRGFPASPRELGDLLSSAEPRTRVLLVRALTERVGPRKALELIKGSGLPLTGTTHLLVHEIGAMAYRVLGYASLEQCTDYFLFACHHGIVIHGVADRGPSGAAMFLQLCKRSGVAAARQCAHAIGHGYLVWSGYRLGPALHLCDQLANSDDALALHCHVGIFMEDIYGVHGRGIRKSFDLLYAGGLKNADLHAPCTSVGEQYRSGCYLNQASRMYLLFNGNLTAIGMACDRISEEKHRTECYDGLARMIHTMSSGNADVVLELCARLAATRQRDCILTVGYSAESIGDQRMPRVLCASLGGTWEGACQGSVEHVVAKRIARSQESFSRGGQSSNETVAYEDPYTNPYSNPYFNPYQNPYLNPYVLPYVAPYPGPRIP